MLVKSVVTIPNYAMQTVILFTIICNSLNKLSINFLWGDMDSAKKTNLVNWEIVCKLKNKGRGGLGVRYDMASNKAILSKLGWNLMKLDSPMWLRVMRKKNGVSKNPRIWKEKVLLPIFGEISIIVRIFSRKIQNGL